jgi:hypothetical protein
VFFSSVYTLDEKWAPFKEGITLAEALPIIKERVTNNQIEQIFMYAPRRYIKKNIPQAQSHGFNLSIYDSKLPDCPDLECVAMNWDTLAWLAGTTKGHCLIKRINEDGSKLQIIDLFKCFDCAGYYYQVETKE